MRRQLAKNKEASVVIPEAFKKHRRDKKGTNKENLALK